MKKVNQNLLTALVACVNVMESTIDDNTGDFIYECKPEIYANAVEAIDEAKSLLKEKEGAPVKIELYHEFSKIDNCHNFGIVTENLQESGFVKNYIQWIWFWIAIKLKNKDVKLFPYSLGKLVYSYKFCNDADKQAETIAKRIDSFFS